MDSMRRTAMPDASTALPCASRGSAATPVCPQY
jgi:hypothetical protein